MKINQLFGLEGRVALVTGAAGHLGSAMASGLAGAGATVLLNGRKAEKLRPLADAIMAEGGKAEIAAFDIRDDAARAGFVEETGQLDILVNNAYFGGPATVDNATIDQFSECQSIGVTAPFALSQSLLPLLRASDQGRIVNIASMYGMVSPDPRLYGDSGNNNPPFYGAAKAGLIQLTKYLAVHLATDGVCVNSISPGAFPPDSIPADFSAKLKNKVPMGRLGKPDDLVAALVYLSSAGAAYTTGTNIVVDGGWTSW